jgi:uncharacterized membrane protein
MIGHAHRARDTDMSKGNKARKQRILVAGESWTTHSIHIKGFDSFETSTYAEGGTEMIAALRAGGYEVDYQPSHIAMSSFPSTAEELSAYGAVFLSDIGANTLLLPNATFVRSERTANRLASIRAYVEAGGGLLMIGGYMTFQGIHGKAAYQGTDVEAVLPVLLHAGDDRRECPEGVVPVINDKKHPVTQGLGSWPHFLGYNRSRARDDASVLASVGDDPFIAVRSVGKGRSAIFASDCGPHWGPPPFLAWKSYGRLWCNLAAWLAKADG